MMGRLDVGGALVRINAYGTVHVEVSAVEWVIENRMYYALTCFFSRLHDIAASFARSLWNYTLGLKGKIVQTFPLVPSVTGAPASDEV